MKRRERSGGGPRGRAKTKTTTKPTAAKAGSMAHPIAKRFSDVVEKAVAALVRRMNGQIRVLGSQHEALASDLCEGLFDDPKEALEPEIKLTERYQAMQERAGKSFKLDADELYQHVRIGAVTLMRAEVQDDVWPGIDWSEKVELLPLLKIPDGLKTFNAGVLFASGPNAGKLHVRQWVQDALPRAPGTRGRPRGETITFAKGTQFNRTGALLGSEAQRERLRAHVERLPAEKRRAFVKGLRKTRENLDKVLEMFDAEDDG